MISQQTQEEVVRTMNAWCEEEELATLALSALLWRLSRMIPRQHIDTLNRVWVEHVDEEDDDA